METLLITKEDSQYNLRIICPSCHCFSKYVDHEDYVETNCSVMCDNCRTYIICPTIDENDDNSIYYMVNGEDLPQNACSKKITQEEAINFTNNLGESVTKQMTKYMNDKTKYYLIHVLEITKLPKKGFYKENYPSDDEDNFDSDDCETFDFDKLTDINHPVTCIGPLKDEYEIDHGGIYLHYVGYCKNCDKTHKSVIWGD